jgi:1-pyrroline-5-carboxylate dehydrogenase
VVTGNDDTNVLTNFVKAFSTQLKNNQTLSAQEMAVKEEETRTSFVEQLSDAIGLKVTNRAKDDGEPEETISQSTADHYNRQTEYYLSSMAMLERIAYAVENIKAIPGDGFMPMQNNETAFSGMRTKTTNLINRVKNSVPFKVVSWPTGAVVGQQPFGGARASGTNDKAGAALNLQRWTSDRSIKETMVPAQNYQYPFMG